MTRSCQHHREYKDDETVVCDVVGECSTIDCAGCKHFELKRAERPERTQRTATHAGYPSGQAGSRLAAIIERETGEHIDCADCQSEVGRLNRLTIEQIAAEIETLAAAIVARGAEQSLAWWRRMACRYAPDIARQTVVEWIREACDPAAALAAPSARDDFSGDPVLHFGAHLWPVRGHWQWHVERWNRIAETINGRCLIGVAMNDATDAEDAVRRALSDRFEVSVRQNTREGENPTFRWLQDVIPNGSNDVLLYCHGKGVQNRTAQSEAVRVWAEVMYESVIESPEIVRRELARGYKVVTAFRTFGRQPLNVKHCWHGSGTFFAVRAKYLSDKPVQAKYGGVEAWPGDHFRADECFVTYGDNCALSEQYNEALLRKRLIEDGRAWKSDRIRRFIARGRQ